MQMPGMDGETLGRAIKRDPRIQDTRLVMCTSLGQTGNDQRWADIGFVAVLTKPVRRQELHNALGAAMRGASASNLRAVTPARLAVNYHFDPARVLVAEDNITNQQVAVGILKNLGLRAEVAANGFEALQALETIPYDLVLMDVQMPELDGFSATRQIRAAEQSRLQVGGNGCGREEKLAKPVVFSLSLHPAAPPHLPIIAMTAHALQGDREKCLRAGMDAYLTKPIEVSALVAVLKQWLKPKLEAQGPRLPTTGDFAPMAQPEQKLLVFDRGALLSRVMNDPDLIRSVIETFLEDMPGQIELLKRHAVLGQIDLIEQQAHKIKGAVAIMGGEALRSVVSSVEQQGRAGDLRGVTAQMPELESQFAAFKAEIMKEL
jgi:CheY-like chemotaxis protein/HPt (histidine-containing phosphotransfer) domain-containing protein